MEPPTPRIVQKRILRRQPDQGGPQSQHGLPPPPAGTPPVEGTSNCGRTPEGGAHLRLQQEPAATRRLPLPICSDEPIPATVVGPDLQHHHHGQQFHQARHQPQRHQDPLHRQPPPQQQQHPHQDQYQRHYREPQQHHQVQNKHPHHPYHSQVQQDRPQQHKGKHSHHQEQRQDQRRHQTHQDQPEEYSQQHLRHQNAVLVEPDAVSLRDRCLANGRVSVTDLVERLLPLIVQSGANWFFNVIPPRSCRPTLAALQGALFRDSEEDPEVTLTEGSTPSIMTKNDLPKRLRLDSSEAHALSRLASGAFTSVTVPLRGELRDIWMKLELSERRQFCIIAAKAIAKLAVALENSSPTDPEHLVQAVRERILDRRSNGLVNAGFVEESLEIEVMRYLAGSLPVGEKTETPEETTATFVAAERELAAAVEHADSPPEEHRPQVQTLCDAQGHADGHTQLTNEHKTNEVQKQQPKKQLSKKEKKRLIASASKGDPATKNAPIRSPRADEFIQLCVALRHEIIAACFSHPNPKSTQSLSSLLSPTFRSLLSGLTKTPAVRDLIAAAANPRTGATKKPPSTNEDFLQWLEGIESMELSQSPAVAEMIHRVRSMPLTTTLLHFRRLLPFCDDVFLSLATQDELSAALAETDLKRKAAGASMEQQVGKGSKRKHKSHAERVLKVNAALVDEIRLQLEATKCQDDSGGEGTVEEGEEDEEEAVVSEEEDSFDDGASHSASEIAEASEATLSAKTSKKKRRPKEAPMPSVTANEVGACVSATAKRVLPTAIAVARLCEAMMSDKADDQDTFAAARRLESLLFTGLAGAKTLRWPILPECEGYRPSAEDRAALLDLSEAFRDPARASVVAASGRKFLEACCSLRDKLLSLSATMQFAVTTKILDEMVATSLAALRKGLRGDQPLQKLVDAVAAVRREMPPEALEESSLPQDLELDPHPTEGGGGKKGKKAKSAKKQENQRLDTRDAELVTWALTPEAGGSFLHRVLLEANTEESTESQLREAVVAMRKCQEAQRLGAALFLQRGGGIILLINSDSTGELARDVADEGVLEDDVLSRVLGSDPFVSYDTEAITTTQRAGPFAHEDQGLGLIGEAERTKSQKLQEAISRLPLQIWVARCTRMRFTLEEQELLTAVLKRSVALDADAELWRWFCQNVARRPFYAIGKGVQFELIDLGQGELDIAIFDATKVTGPVLLAAVEVKRHAADIVKAQHQRVSLEEKVATAITRRQGAKCILKCTGKDSHIDLARRPYNGLVRDVFALFHAQPVQRWFVALAVEKSKGVTKELDLSVLPSKARNQFAAKIASTLTNSPHLVRSLRAELRFHPEYLNWLGASTGSSGKKSKAGLKTSALKDWFNIVPLMQKHASELCSRLAETQNASKRCVGKDARSPLEVVSEMLDAGVVSTNLILVDLFAIKKEEMKAKRKNAK